MAVNKPVGGQRAQGRRQEAFATEDQAWWRYGLYQAQQKGRRVHGRQKAGEGQKGRQKV
jgi:hypothetical protein